MKLAKPICKTLFAISVLIVSMMSASATTFTLSSTGQGWVQSTGLANAGLSTSNYLAGWCVNCGSIEFRNYFSFAIPFLDGPVTSAVLNLNTAVYESPDATETYDVTSYINATFANLGTGTLFGTHTYNAGEANTVQSISLNAAAISAIVSGSPFTVSGRVTTLSLGALNEVVFGLSGASAELVLDTAPSVPEPATMGLIGLGFVALGATARRRRK